MLEFSPNVRLTEVSLAKAGQHSQHAVGNAGNVSALRHTVARMEAQGASTKCDARLEKGMLSSAVEPKICQSLTTFILSTGIIEAAGCMVTNAARHPNSPPKLSQEPAPHILNYGSKNITPEHKYLSSVGAELSR